MIFSAITLALLSLLVATEPDPVASTELGHEPDSPVRPSGHDDRDEGPDQSEIAA